jgi:type VI secretion system secreted protein Hcp
MAQGTRIKVDDVEGESTHRDHKGEIEVLSWKLGAAVTAPSCGGAASKATAADFRFSHVCDKATPVLPRTGAR